MAAISTVLKAEQIRLANECNGKPNFPSHSQSKSTWINYAIQVQSWMWSFIRSVWQVIKCIIWLPLPLMEPGKNGHISVWIRGHQQAGWWESTLALPQIVAWPAFHNSNHTDPAMPLQKISQACPLKWWWCFANGCARSRCSYILLNNHCIWSSRGPHYSHRCSSFLEKSKACSSPWCSPCRQGWICGRYPQEAQSCLPCYIQCGSNPLPCSSHQSILDSIWSWDKKVSSSTPELQQKNIRLISICRHEWRLDKCRFNLPLPSRMYLISSSVCKCSSKNDLIFFSYPGSLSGETVIISCMKLSSMTCSTWAVQRIYNPLGLISAT